MKRPVCPYCGREMEVVQHHGYYDVFNYWECASGNCFKKLSYEKPDRDAYGNDYHLDCLA